MGRAVRADAQLLGDVGDDPRVRGGGGREHGRRRRQLSEKVLDTPVVGPEVVAPVADAVGLVDDEQTAALGQRRQLVLAEARVVEALGTHQQQVDRVDAQRLPYVLPLGRVRGVHGHGADPGPLGGADLVAHQGQQRRDDEGRPGTFSPAQHRGDEVDRRLAPAGALDHERSPPVLDEGLDCLRLPVAEVGVGVADQPPEGCECVVGHRVTVGGATDTSDASGVAETALGTNPPTDACTSPGMGSYEQILADSSRWPVHLHVRQDAADRVGLCDSR